jgi:hypothetical protein
LADKAEKLVHSWRVGKAAVDLLQLIKTAPMAQ